MPENVTCGISSLQSHNLFLKNVLRIGTGRSVSIAF
jgi:hypothetical protein